MGTEAAWVPLVVGALAAGGSYVNTQNTAKRQDEAAAQAIRSQSLLQRKADQQIGDTVQKLEGSTAEASRGTRLEDYLSQLRRNQSTTNNGLSPTIGSQTFQADSANRAAGASDYASKNAGLMARMDAPQIQRQQEGFDYGNLATDIGLIGRESQGQNFLDQLKQNRIRRNAKIDLASGLLSAAAGGVANSGTAAASGAGNAYGNTYSSGDGLTYNMPSY